MENTSNYGLKRWDGEDRILHTEFNDNWDKIDTAIKGSADKAAAALAATTALEQKMGWQLLKSTTKLMDSGRYLQLELSDMDLSKYSALHIRADLKGRGYSFFTIQNQDLRNNRFDIQGGPMCLTLWTMREKNAYLSGVQFGYGAPTLLSFNAKVSELKQILVWRSDDAPLTGGTLSLYGEA
ncbi:hypothetical protein [Dysosmobacter sp.]|uniref:hypothetical protein n=1 Tax=Dysosmobacter sp. TaxID=2591382 RepID=UPI003A8DA122